MKMNINYLVEIRLFYDRLETAPLPPAAIALWHGLMYLAHKAGWPQELSIPIGTLEARSGLERRSVYRTRIVLRDEGLIDFREQTGNRSTLYRLISLEIVAVCGTDLSHSPPSGEGERYNSDTQTVTQAADPPEVCSTDLSHKDDLRCISDTQGEICGADLTHKPPPADSERYNFDTHATICSTDLSHSPPSGEGERYNSDTQTVTHGEPCSTDLAHKDDLQYAGDTQVAVCSTDLAHKPENDPYISIYINKDIDKGGYRGKKKNGEGDAKSPKKKRAGFDLSFIGDEVWEGLVESWLDYKRSRSENYKSDLSVKKFHTMLRNYSCGDPGLARQIIDKSIANNWAGIFELAPDDGKPRNQSAGVAARPATGQRIGQIKQPEDDERRQKLLAKFDSKK